MEIKDSQIRIQELNDEIFEIERELGDMMDRMRTEQIKLEYEQQKEVARNNPSYLRDTFKSVQDFNASYKYSATESLLNNGRMKGSKGAKIKDSEGSEKQRKRKRTQGAVKDTLCSGNKCAIF